MASNNKFTFLPLTRTSPFFYLFLLICFFTGYSYVNAESKNLKSSLYYIAADYEQRQTIRNKSLEIILLQKLKEQARLDRAYVEDSTIWLATQTDRLKLGHAIVQQIGARRFSAKQISSEIDKEVLQMSSSCSKYAVDRLKPFFTDKLQEIHSRNMYCTLSETNVQVLFWHIRSKKYYIRLHLIRYDDEEIIDISNVIQAALENDFGFDFSHALRAIPQAFLDGKVKYAKNVDYYDKGIVGLDYIRRDKAKYFARWPVRNYQLLLDTIELLEQYPYQITLQFSYRYSVSRPGKTAQGVATVQLELVEQGNTYFVASVKEKVFSDKK